YLSKTVPLISEETQRQAQRNVSFRARLLEEEGAETYESLAVLRGRSQSTTRAWVARHRDRLTMFTIEVEGKTLIPKVQLTDRGGLKKNVAALITPLLKAEIGAWGLWSWLTAPTGLLSDEIPAVGAETHPDRALTAAELYAADLRDAKARIGWPRSSCRRNDSTALMPHGAQSRSESSPRPPEAAQCQRLR